MKKSILIMGRYYLPGVKGGGPIRSIKNLTDNFSDQYDFHIVAADRDLGDKKAFDDIIVNQWTKVDHTNVLYTNARRLSARKLVKIFCNVDFEILYLNSFFDYKFSIVPIILSRLKIIRPKKIILAPRGQFSKGALKLKWLKKSIFLFMVKKLELYRGITWQATAETEKEDIEALFGENLDIKVANNLTANYNQLIFDKKIDKVRGQLKLVFVSRIHPKKNLKLALEVLRYVEGSVIFDIYGPIEDKLYWSECQAIIRSLPSNIMVEYRGSVGHHEIINLFKCYHVFLFPTLGENYGHVISEALIGGCPVIVSDQTPWRNLVCHKAGWDIPLENKSMFIEVINKCLSMDRIEYYELSNDAFLFGLNKSNQQQNIQAYIQLFND